MDVLENNFLQECVFIHFFLYLRRKWVGGEVIQAVAYDVPIPGYKTKNTNSLRLWEAKASSDDFNLFQFNDGQYESAALLHSRAQQVKIVHLFNHTMLKHVNLMLVRVNGLILYWCSY